MKKRLTIIFATLLSVVASLAFTACAKNDPPPHVHEYTSVTTNATCTTAGYTTFTCTCGDTYTTPIPALGHVVDYAELVEPTCTTSGSRDYYFCENCDEKWEDEDCTQSLGNEPITIPAIGHHYSEDEWTWNGYTSAHIKISCSNDDCDSFVESTVSGSGISSYTSTYPTCTQEGVKTYRASYNFEGVTFEDTTTETLPAINHSFGEPTWTWDNTYSTAQAHFECENDYEHTQDLTATISSEVTVEPTCHSNGQTTYTATVVLDGETYTDVKTAYDVDRTEHTYTVDETSWYWSYHYTDNEKDNFESLYTAKVDVVCAVDDCYYSSEKDAIVTAEMTTPVECTTDGEVTYTASYDLDGTVFSTTKTHTIRSKGHTYVDSNVCTACEYYNLYLTSGSENGVEFLWASGFYSYQNVMTKMYIPAVLWGKPIRVNSFGNSPYPNVTDIYIEEGVEYVSINSLERDGWNSSLNVYLPSTLQTLHFYAYNATDIAPYCTLYENGYYMGTQDNPYFALVTIEDTSISEFTIHNDTVLVADSAFGNDKSNTEFTNLTTVNVGKNLKAIPENLFDECPAIATINVDSENAYLAEVDGVIYDKDVTKIVCIPKKLAGDVVIPDTVTAPIPNGAFMGSLITSIVIGDGVPSVGIGAFNECNLLTSAVIGDSVVTLGAEYTSPYNNYAFAYCDALEYLSIGKSVEHFYTSMSYDKYTGAGLKVLNVENLDNFIKYNRFNIGFTYEHKNVTFKVKGETTTTLIVPEGVTEYNTNINMFDILHVVMPSTLQSIGAGTFNNNRTLLTINIPASVTTIGQNAFGGCKNTLVYCEAESKPEGWHEDWNDDINTRKCITFWGAPTDVTEGGSCVVEKDDMLFILDKENDTASFYSYQSQALKGDENGVFTVPIQINYEGVLYTVTTTYGDSIESSYIKTVRVSKNFDSYSLVANPYFYNIEFLGSKEEFTEIYGTYYDSYIEDGKITFFE